MDQPADPQTPLAQAYQAFFADLAAHGVNAASLEKYRYDILRFERWLIDTGQSTLLSSLMDQAVLLAYRGHLETMPQQRLGAKRRRRSGTLSKHTVHSYLSSIKCLCSWLHLGGYIPIHPFKPLNPYFRKTSAMRELRRNDRIPKVGYPDDVQMLLPGCVGDEPENLRDRAIIWSIYGLACGPPTPAT